jgi:hypothetical protein
MQTETEIWSEFQENYRYAHDYWSPFVANAHITTLAASGYTWSDQERKELVKEGREGLELNIIRRPLQFFSGYLRDNINSVVIAPIEGSDQKTADQLTKLSYYVWDKGEGFPIFLDAADEAFKSGMSLCGLQMDYTKDFINGDITFYNRTFNSFYLDPTFERIDLRDCAFAITRDLLDRNLVKQLLPFVDPTLIDNIQNSYRDEKFRSYHPNFTTLSRNRNLMAYDQYYKRVTRSRKMLIDENASYYRDITDLNSEDIEKLKKGLYRLRKLHQEANERDESTRNIPPLVDIREVNRDYVELHIMLNGQQVYSGDDKTGITHTYPFVPLICYMEPAIWMPSQRIQGIATTLWSAQRQFNKRHMKIVDMMDTTISTGFKYLIGSVPDPQELQQSGQSKLIGVDPENAPQGLDSVQELHGGQSNPALVQYQEVLDKLVLSLANVNESILGIDEKGNTQVSGRLAQVRIAQGLRTNRKIFDNVEQSQKVLGGLVLRAMQNQCPPGKVKRILGEEPTEQFYEKEFEQYDAVIKEGVRSQSQKDAYYYELINLKRDEIVDVPQSEIVRALQMAGLSDLQEAISKQDQERQQQQQKLNEQEQLALKLANSQAEANLAISDERRARIQTDISTAEWHRSEAEQNIAQAQLDRAKTIVEIAKMGDDRILAVLEMINQMKAQEAQEQQAQSAETEARAKKVTSSGASAQSAPKQ